MLGSRAATEAGPAAISSSLPFLYQTRTLSNWTLTGTSRSRRSRYCNAILRRHYGDFHRSRAPAPPRQQFTITRTTTTPGRFDPQRSSEAESTGLLFKNSSESSSKTTPASSHTKAPFPVSWSLDIVEGGSETNPMGKSINARANELDGGMGFSDELDLDDEVGMEHPLMSDIQPEEIQDLTRKHGARVSTITDQERAAFQKIFSDIFNRSNRSSMSQESNFISNKARNLANDPFEMLDEHLDLHLAKRKLGNILTTAMQRQPQSREAMEAALEKYPTPLRAAAAKAMGYIEDETEFEKTRPNRSALLVSKELEALREPERLRVERLMNAARTDFELMEIMEKEVFSLIPKLGLADNSQRGANAQSSTPLTSRKKKGWKKAEKARNNSKEKPQTEQQESPETVTGTPSGLPDDGISPLALYGPLYPSYLLLGLRLLDRSFAKPSPLSLSILPKIKSLGYISRILGGSTQLYNELLRIYRFRHDDFRGMVALLKEMEHAAVEYDEATLWIVRDLRNLQVSIFRGEKGSTLKALWAMPEFSTMSITHWTDKIIKAVVERENKAREHLQFPQQSR